MLFLFFLKFVFVWTLGKGGATENAGLKIVWKLEAVQALNAKCNRFFKNLDPALLQGAPGSQQAASKFKSKDDKNEKILINYAVFYLILYPLT